MTSVKTQLPYEYYVLPFCHKGINLKAQDALNLGEVLRGTRIYETPYKFSMDQDAVPAPPPPTPRRPPRIRGHASGSQLQHAGGRPHVPRCTVRLCPPPSLSALTLAMGVAWGQTCTILCRAVYDTQELQVCRAPPLRAPSPGSEALCSCVFERARCLRARVMCAGECRRAALAERDGQQLASQELGC